MDIKFCPRRSFAPCRLTLLDNVTKGISSRALNLCITSERKLGCSPLFLFHFFRALLLFSSTGFTFVISSRLRSIFSFVPRSILSIELAEYLFGRELSRVIIARDLLIAHWGNNVNVLLFQLIVPPLTVLLFTSSSCLAEPGRST